MVKYNITKSPILGFLPFDNSVHIPGCSSIKMERIATVKKVTDSGGYVA
jgi:hypothetical protein